MTDNQTKKRNTLATTIVVGAAIGAGVSAATDFNLIGMWIAIGVSVGVAIGTSLNTRREKAGDDSESETPQPTSHNLFELHVLIKYVIY